MDIEKYIEKIVENGRLEDMEDLSDMLENVLEIIKDYDETCYKEFEMELYKMAYGRNLTKEMAEKIVNKMQPFGQRWSFQETRQIQNERGINNVSDADFYVVINSAYNDYNNLFKDNIEDYVCFTMDFINDEDAKQGKVFTYYTEIPL